MLLHWPSVKVGGGDTQTFRTWWETFLYWEEVKLKWLLKLLWVVWDWNGIQWGWLQIKLRNQENLGRWNKEHGIVAENGLHNLNDFLYAYFFGINISKWTKAGWLNRKWLRLSAPPSRHMSNTCFPTSHFHRSDALPRPTNSLSKRTHLIRFKVS